MTAAADVHRSRLEPASLKTTFLKWQCRVRQMMMRDNYGRPDDGITPAVILPGAAEPLGHIITLLNKDWAHSVTPELEHMAAKTNDPAQRRDQALRFLSSSYYQKHAEFSDVLTATFPGGSPGAAQLLEAGRVSLVFEAYSQRFELVCNVGQLEPFDALYRATLAHNRLFNPGLPADTLVLGFTPDWSASKDVSRGGAGSQ